MTPLRELFLLDPDVVYLNHGSFGACPRPVFERYQWWQRELEREPVQFIKSRLADLLARRGRSSARSWVLRPTTSRSSRTRPRA